MIAAAERAKVHAVELRRPEAGAHAVVRGVLLEALPVLRDAVRLALAHGDALLELLLERAPERHLGERLGGDVRLRGYHAAADIHAHGSRNDGALRRHHAADGHTVALMRVRHQRHVMYKRRMVREVHRLLDGALLAVLAPALHWHRVPGFKLFPLHGSFLFLN